MPMPSDSRATAIFIYQLGLTAVNASCIVAILKSGNPWMIWIPAIPFGLTLTLAAHAYRRILVAREREDSAVWDTFEEDLSDA